MFFGIPLLLQAQTVPNGDFETWTFNNNGMAQPHFWQTQNEPELIYVEALPGRSGNHSACLNVQWDFMLKKHCGATLKSEFSILENKRYKYLKGFCMGSSENIDTLFIEINLFSKNKLIGNGFTKILDNSGTWDTFTVPVNYFTTEIPDKAIISISINSSKGGHYLTTYCIDDLLLAHRDLYRTGPGIIGVSC